MCCTVSRAESSLWETTQTFRYQALRGGDHVVVEGCFSGVLYHNNEWTHQWYIEWWIVNNCYVGESQQGACHVVIGQVTAHCRVDCHYGLSVNDWKTFVLLFARFLYAFAQIGFSCCFSQYPRPRCPDMGPPAPELWFLRVQEVAVPPFIRMMLLQFWMNCM